MMRALEAMWQGPRQVVRQAIRPYSRRRDRVRRGILLAGLCAVGGCASDTTGPAPVSPERLYTQLTLAQHGITLALTPPYDTVQLTVTPYTAAGTVLSDTSPTIWTSSDTTSVQVSATGVLKALAPTTGLLVSASRQIGRVTNTDTAYVNVTPLPTPVPVASRITFTPTLCVFNNTAVCAVLNVYTLIPTVLDQQGQSIANVAIGVTSRAPNILLLGGSHRINEAETSSGTTINYNNYSGGDVVLVTDAVVYGTRLKDSVTLHVPWPQFGLIQIVPRHAAGATVVGMFTPAEDTVAVGGTVIWQNELPGTALADVVFDDSSAAQAVDSATFLGGFNTGQGTHGIYIPNEGGGNIRPFLPRDTVGVDASGQSITTPAARARQFPVAGTYRYHSALYGTSGILYVVP